MVLEDDDPPRGRLQGDLGGAVWIEEDCPAALEVWGAVEVEHDGEEAAFGAVALEDGVDVRGEVLVRVVLAEAEALVEAEELPLAGGLPVARQEARQPRKVRSSEERIVHNHTAPVVEGGVLGPGLKGGVVLVFEVLGGLDEVLALLRGEDVVKVEGSPVGEVRE
uniref:Uncharacterized protein n=1 Tax=Arcella intermedia TaxID=1963864 RepID=A0A6B2LIQ7_9EUKA